MEGTFALMRELEDILPCRINIKTRIYSHRMMGRQYESSIKYCFIHSASLNA